jgi:hypothetical protein
MKMATTVQLATPFALVTALQRVDPSKAKVMVPPDTGVPLAAFLRVAEKVLFSRPDVFMGTATKTVGAFSTTRFPDAWDPTKSTFEGR